MIFSLKAGFRVPIWYVLPLQGQLTKTWESKHPESFTQPLPADYWKCVPLLMSSFSMGCLMPHVLMVISSLTVLWILKNIFSSSLKAELDPLYAAQEKPTASVSLVWDRQSSHQSEPCLKKISSRPPPLTEGGKHETQTDRTNLFVATSVSLKTAIVNPKTRTEQCARQS